MTTKIKKVCVFCGARTGIRATYAQAAEQLGRLMARHNLDLVYGGGHVGLMGIVADAVLAGGAQVIGVIPKDMVEKELAHQGLSELHVVDTMHERKALMEKRSDCVVALPGGFGTLDELCEILTWSQLGYHRKPIFLLNTDGYYTQFLRFVDYATEEGFIAKKDLGLFQICSSPEELLGQIVSEPAS